MKTELKVVLLSLAFGAFVCVSEASFDYIIFYRTSFVGLLFTDVPPHEVFIRLMIMGCFAVFGFISAKMISAQKLIKQKLESALLFQQQLLDSVPVPIFYKDQEYVYLGCNKSFEKFIGIEKQNIIGKTVYDISPPDLAAVYHEKDFELINNPGVQIYEFSAKSKKDGSEHSVIFHKATYEDRNGKVAGLIGAMLDITERKKVEQEKELLIGQLQDALDKVKVLSGFIPICASCKKVRDDKGYWNQIESYIKEHSSAEFSHSICPECAKKLYPELKIPAEKKNKENEKEGSG